MIYTIRYYRDAAGLVTREPHGTPAGDWDRHETAAALLADYPHAARLLGWPESVVYWTARTGPAHGRAVVATSDA